MLRYGFLGSCIFHLKIPIQNPLRLLGCLQFILWGLGISITLARLTILIPFKMFPGFFLLSVPLEAFSLAIH